jgi:hypothetical protein
MSSMWGKDTEKRVNKNREEEIFLQLLSLFFYPPETRQGWLL